MEKNRTTTPTATTEFIFIEDACKILMLARPTVYRMAQNRRVPFYKRGRKLLFKADELRAYMEKYRVNMIDQPA